MQVIGCRRRLRLGLLGQRHPSADRERDHRRRPLLGGKRHVFRRAQTAKPRVAGDDLEEGEGVAVCPDGGLFYSEKKKGWIKRYRPGQNDDIVVRGLHDPSFLMCDGEGLWITEDLTHGARLYLLDAFGNMQTILTRLRSPQTIIPVAPSRFLLAEQGRGRILELTRLSGGTK